MSQTTEIRPPLLISEEYRQMRQQLHENPKYDVASVAYASLVAKIITRRKECK